MIMLNMKDKYLILLNLIFSVMTVPVFSQDLPAVDQIPTSAGIVNMHFIGHGSLMFDVNDYIIHIDPVRSSGKYDTLQKADLILVTHEHSDHLDNELINDLRKSSTLLYTNANSASRIPWAQKMLPGDKKVSGIVTIEAVPAYNIVNERSKGMVFHPRGVGNGYVLTIGDKRFYIAGDTENTPEMKALKNIDVAFLPMNLPYTMTPEMVADAVKSFKPRILYPYHFSDTNTDLIVNLLKDTEIQVRIRKLN